MFDLVPRPITFSDQSHVAGNILLAWIKLLVPEAQIVMWEASAVRFSCTHYPIWDTNNQD